MSSFHRAVRARLASFPAGQRDPSCWSLPRPFVPAPLPPAPSGEGRQLPGSGPWASSRPRGTATPPPPSTEGRVSCPVALPRGPGDKRDKKHLPSPPPTLRSDPWRRKPQSRCPPGAWSGTLVGNRVSAEVTKVPMQVRSHWTGGGGLDPARVSLREAAEDTQGRAGAWGGCEVTEADRSDVSTPRKKGGPLPLPRSMCGRSPVPAA